MKHALLFVSLLSVASIQAGAQDRPSLRKQNTTTASPSAGKAELQTTPAATGVPRVLLGTIESSTASREKILAYPRLLPQELGCEVKGYSFSISAGSVNWHTDTVKGAVFTEEIKDKIKETEAPEMTITISNIVLQCGGKDETANNIVISYNH